MILLISASQALVGGMSAGSALLPCVRSPEGLHAPPVPPALIACAQTAPSLSGGPL